MVLRLQCPGLTQSIQLTTHLTAYMNDRHFQNYATDCDIATPRNWLDTVAIEVY